MTRNISVISIPELTRLLDLYKRLGKPDLPVTMNPHNGSMETIAPDEYNLVPWPREVLFGDSNAGQLYYRIFNSPASPEDCLKIALEAMDVRMTDVAFTSFCRDHIPGYANYEKFMSESIWQFLQGNNLGQSNRVMTASEAIQANIYSGLSSIPLPK